MPPQDAVHRLMNLVEVSRPALTLLTDWQPATGLGLAHYLETGKEAVWPTSGFIVEKQLNTSRDSLTTPADQTRVRLTAAVWFRVNVGESRSGV